MKPIFTFVPKPNRAAFFTWQNFVLCTAGLLLCTDILYLLPPFHLPVWFSYLMYPLFLGAAVLAVFCGELPRLPGMKLLLLGVGWYCLLALLHLRSPIPYLYLLFFTVCVGFALPWIFKNAHPSLLSLAGLCAGGLGALASIFSIWLFLTGSQLALPFNGPGGQPLVLGAFTGEGAYRLNFNMHPNDTAANLAMLLFLTLGFAVRSASHRTVPQRIYYGMCGALLLIALFLTDSRSVILSMAAAAAVFAFFCAFQARGAAGKKQMLFAVCAALVVLIIYFAGYKAVTATAGRIHTALATSQQEAPTAPNASKARNTAAQSGWGKQNSTTAQADTAVQSVAVSAEYLSTSSGTETVLSSTLPTQPMESARLQNPGIQRAASKNLQAESVQNAPFSSFQRPSAQVKKAQPRIATATSSATLASQAAVPPSLPLILTSAAPQTENFSDASDIAPRGFLVGLRDWWGRKPIWTASFQAIADNPAILLIGCGPDNGSVAELLNTYPITKDYQFYNQHSDYLYLLCGLGIPGILLALCFIVFVVRRGVLLLRQKSVSAMHASAVSAVAFCLINSLAECSTLPSFSMLSSIGFFVACGCVVFFAEVMPSGSAAPASPRA